MSDPVLVFPNQLYADHPALRDGKRHVFLVGESLFFNDARYPARFHKQKLWLHKASMDRYARHLEGEGHVVDARHFADGETILEDLFAEWAGSGVKRVATVRLTDFILGKRLQRFANRTGIEIEWHDDPGFLNLPEDNRRWRARSRRWLMADFYKWQRRRLDILMDGDEPRGGRWSFDEDNRKPVPRKLLNGIPPVAAARHGIVEREAQDWVEAFFPDNPGSLDRLVWPTDHVAAADWLAAFVDYRLASFGDYEDAIVRGETFLWHSAMTPMLNIGLLTPRQVVDAVHVAARANDLPLNAVEGFLRQVIGWREFMRAAYDELGVRMRTSNHWNHHRHLPRGFYNATTGIPPVDDAIGRILETGYCHHIERLMVLGGFLFLTETRPDHVYGWFMDMFVDSYDWVMVPNVHAMSQNADGGLITTKPYFSGSNYILKMSNHERGAWCDVWDALYWRWISKNSGRLEGNPRWAMMVAAARKMDSARMERHIAVAEEWLAVH